MRLTDVRRATGEISDTDLGEIGLIDLDRLVAEATHLEPLPASIPRLASLVADENSDLSEIVEVISLDQTLTLKLLHAANSAASASRVQITTAQTAVTRLGTAAVLSLAMGGAVRDGLDPGIRGMLNRAGAL